MSTIDEIKRALELMIAAALAEARREGAEQMRAAVESALDDLPLPTSKRQAVLLTDEQIKQARNKALCDAPDGVLMGRVAGLWHPELRELSRAIEAAAHAANNLEVRRG